ncbi:2OG-Fe(II) oxygenase superfamily protein [Erythrobacter litoralis]|uniref:Phytanoyl-CoA dioxygenase n=1 Tax=Erythrobacter litoralis TaxID=39960 RepID=A0A074M7I1_9SPHN|nr:phytanoyl-CoA dioxygenase family protein [Erythrobacter litoralis]AOL22042.1 2OG-Fe(II) oxygenase superfamily protein [Erythrobacter litoralis]KEO90701.1 phytanoyl-CoA dioxygenase [Erythrobacter litoralis]
MTWLRRLKTALQTPIWTLQLASGTKSFIDNPIIGSRRLNALGLHQSRVRIAERMCRWRRKRLAAKVPHEWRDAFERDGFVVIENAVPSEDFEGLRDAILSQEWPAREMRQGDAITRRIAIDGEMLAEIPELKRFLGRSDINALFHYVASYRTTPLHYVQTIVSSCGGEAPDPQETLHADTFHASMKSWLFLKPVTEADGPFTYVPGSHRFSEARLKWEYERSLVDPRSIDRLSARGSPRVDENALIAMDLGAAEKISVPANTLVVADTSGFHARGSAQCKGERVELWSYARRNPFLPWLGGDLLSLPGIAERRVGWLWSLRDRLERQMGQPWQSVGRRRAIDD